MPCLSREQFPPFGIRIARSGCRLYRLRERHFLRGQRFRVLAFCETEVWRWRRGCTLVTWDNVHATFAQICALK